VRELALLFLRLGATAFGGPAAHIAMMEDEVVRRRGWLTREKFLDLHAATNLIPGPNSTEMAIHVGYLRGGWRGLLVAGLCFILPATLITAALAWLYVGYGAVPEAAGLLYGVKAVVLAVVLHALWRLGRSALRTRGLAAVAVAAVVANALGVHELVVLAAAGLLVVAARARPPRATALAVPLVPLFLVFLKIGSVLFGSGYVLLAFLRADFVHRFGWLTEQQLLDAVAAGQVTPGPVFSTATFVGYLLGGASGALLATAGIFLPAFVFVALSGPLVPRLRASRTAGAFLDGVVVASLGLMAVVTWQLGRVAIVDVPSAAIALVASVLLWRRVNSAWLVLGGALLGLAIDGLR
jgi:chromate transporter